MSKKKVIYLICTYGQAIAFIGIMFFGLLVAGADRQDTIAGVNRQFNEGLTGFIVMVAVMIVTGLIKICLGGYENDEEF